MKVKIGDRWHDSHDEPICIQVSEKEQSQIASMDRSVATQGKYASFPDGWGTPHAMFEWMDSPVEAATEQTGDAAEEDA